MEAPHPDVFPKRVSFPLVAKCSLQIAYVKAVKREDTLYTEENFQMELRPEKPLKRGQ